MKMQKAPSRITGVSLGKSKFGQPLGFKAVNAYGEKKLTKTKGAGFDPGRFKTQHKG